MASQGREREHESEAGKKRREGGREGERTTPAAREPAHIASGVWHAVHDIQSKCAQRQDTKPAARRSHFAPPCTIGDAYNVWMIGLNCSCAFRVSAFEAGVHCTGGQRRATPRIMINALPPGALSWPRTGLGSSPAGGGANNTHAL